MSSRLLAWATTRLIGFEPEVDAALRSGFAPPWGGSDGFDALAGLLAALAVVNGEAPAGDPPEDTPGGVVVRRWEGWILGRTPRMSRVARIRPPP